MTNREAIIEFIIQNQGHFKHEVERLRGVKNRVKANEQEIFHSDIEDQYEARIKQLISFITADALAIPVEYVIIELDGIDMEELFNV